MKYKKSTLGRWYLKMPTLYVYTYEDGTLWYYQQQINFQVKTKGQPRRWYCQDGTLREECWYDLNGQEERCIVYNPDGSVLRDCTY